MRVVSGKYRGKKLKEFELISTKPTTDRVKEAMFNLIQFDIINASVLDLFSGTGGLGIEAISRGAKLVHMVDSNKQAINIIKQNLIGVQGNFKVFNEDYQTHLNKLYKYDIVLLDPPYKENFGVVAIDFILKHNMLNDGGIIIFETSEQNNFEFNYKNISVDKRKYGTVVLYKLTYENGN